MKIEIFPREKLAAWAASKPTIRALYVFGSRAKGTAGPDSDLDLAFDLEPRNGEALAGLIDNDAAWRTEFRIAPGCA